MENISQLPPRGIFQLSTSSLDVSTLLFIPVSLLYH